MNYNPRTRSCRTNSKLSLTTSLMCKGFKSRLRNRFISKQAQSLVMRIVRNMLDEASNNILTTKDKVHEKVMNVTRISRTMLHQIIRETECIEFGTIQKYSSFLPEKKKELYIIDHSILQHSGVLRQIIQEQIIKDYIIPSVQNVLVKLNKETKLSYSRQDLKYGLKQIGYKYQVIDNKMSLREKFRIRMQRSEFLQNMKRYRNDDKPVVYVGAMESDDIILIHAGWQIGFVPGALYDFKPNYNTSNSYRKISPSQFLEYVENSLIPNLPSGCVVVLKSCHYTSELVDDCPKPFSRKTVMENWLRLRNILFDSNMLKTDLYEIIKQHKPNYTFFRIDKKLIENGFEVIRLPPNHGELNVIEQLFKILREELNSRCKNRKKVLCYTEVKNVSYESLENKSMDWVKIYEKIQELERKYIENDEMVENIMDKMNFTEIYSSDSESDSNVDDFDDGEDSDDITKYINMRNSSSQNN